MKANFEFKGHTVVLHRGIGRVSLKIDGETQSVVTGLFAAHMKKSICEGVILNGRDKGDKIKVVLKIGFITDTIDFYYNGALIETKSTFV